MILVGCTVHLFINIILLSTWNRILMIFSIKKLYCIKDEELMIYTTIRRAAIMQFGSLFLAPIFLAYALVNTIQYSIQYII